MRSTGYKLKFEYPINYKNIKILKQGPEANAFFCSLQLQFKYFYGVIRDSFLPLNL